MFEAHAAKVRLLTAGAALLVLAGCLGSGGEEAPATEANTGIGAVMRVADTTRARGDLVTAAGLYRRAHELAPDAAEPLVRLGFVLRDGGAPGEAASAFAAALDREPSNADARRGLGLSLLDTGDAEGALAQFEAALAAGSAADPRLYNAVGVAYDMLGNRVTAQAWYREGLALDANNLTLLSNLGLSMALNGDGERAVEILERVVRDPAAGASLRQNLALAYGLAGREEAAGAMGRIDLDEDSVRANLETFEQLRTDTGGLYAEPEAPEVPAAPMVPVEVAPVMEEAAPDDS